MNLEQYRSSQSEQLRIANLMGLVPHKGSRALDVGARDGFLSIQLAGHFDHVTALDLVRPDIRHPQVTPLAGDITGLDFADNAFDLVLCAEVLEHIPPVQLAKACGELARVTQGHLLVGVPYNQDLRFGRTTCFSCGQKNPPWGHVNRFDLAVLQALFPGMAVERVEYVGVSKARTNRVSVFLFDLAGNPFGTYGQEEACVHCDKKLLPPPPRTLLQRALTRLATYIVKTQRLFIKEQANWIHVLLKK